MKNNWLMVTVVEVICDEAGAGLVTKFGRQPIKPPSSPHAEAFFECTPSLIALIKSSPDSRFFILTWNEEFDDPDRRIPEGLPIAGHIIAKAARDGSIYNENSEKVGDCQDFSYGSSHMVFLHLFSAK